MGISTLWACIFALAVAGLALCFVAGQSIIDGPDMDDYRAWRDAQLPACCAVVADSTGLHLDKIDGSGGMLVGAKAFCDPAYLRMVEDFLQGENDED